MGVNFLWYLTFQNQVLPQNQKPTHHLAAAKIPFQNFQIVQLAPLKILLLLNWALVRKLSLKHMLLKALVKHTQNGPVATAWYRMLPEVVLLEEIEGKVDEQLKAKCPVNAFDIEDIGNGK